uniref:Uncharacterized protein n=1 Tax=Anguilla anguilla TaxID=7936 RepID=A0A0E9U8L8_ANGAN
MLPSLNYITFADINDVQCKYIQSFLPAVFPVWQNGRSLICLVLSFTLSN